MKRVRRVQVAGGVGGVEEVEDEEVVGEEGGEVIDTGIFDFIAKVCLRCIRRKFHKMITDLFGHLGILCLRTNQKHLRSLTPFH